MGKKLCMFKFEFMSSTRATLILGLASICVGVCAMVWGSATFQSQVCKTFLQIYRRSCPAVQFKVSKFGLRSFTVRYFELVSST